MKNKTKYNKTARTILFLSLYTIVTLIIITSCYDDQNHKDSKEVAEEHNKAKFENEGKEEDAQFLVEAAESTLEEIQLGELVQNTSKSEDVKKLAKMMQNDHQAILKEINSLAHEKTITVPYSMTDESQDKYDRLNSKTGSEFDMEYCDMMIRGHENSISLYDEAAQNSKDHDIKRWAVRTLPILRTHLDHALICKRKCEEKLNK